MVYQIAYGVLGNQYDAEDVSQDVFLRAYRKLGGLRNPEKFRAWVARMSRRLALNHQRAASRAQRRNSSWIENTAPPVESAETEVTARDLNARLGEEIRCLPEKLRSVLLLNAVDGLDTREVAVVLGIPEGTVRSRLHSARKQLRTAIAGAALIASIVWVTYGVALKNERAQSTTLASAGVALSHWQAPTDVLLHKKSY